MTGDAPHDPLRQRLVDAISASYEIGDRIGAGAMGAVFAAHDRRHARQVAIKVIREEVASAMLASRFHREIRIAAGLHHPHILPLFDSGDAGGLLYFVTPLIVGESLRQRIARERQLPMLDVCRIVRQVAAALTHAHQSGVVHRDVKPDNILLAGADSFVADFGVAKAAAADAGETGLTSDGMAVGTPIYMSPEQAAAEPNIDGRADQYALACVAYELLGGEPPFTGSNPRAVLARHMSQRPPDIRLLRPTVSGEAEAILQRALAKSPVDRFRTASEFADALERALTGPVRAHAESATESVRTSRLASTAHAGRLVSKTCNRWAQMNAFDSFLRASRRLHPGRPQMYLLHGEEGDAHDSLLERLIETTLSRFAEDIAGVERGSVVRVRVPWPDVDDLESACRDLSIALHREADPTYLGDDLSIASLSATFNQRPQRVVVVHHDIRASHWRRFTPDVVSWYANDFWGALTPKPTDQQYVVFLKLILPSESSRSLIGGLLRRLTSQADGRRMQRELKARLMAPDCRCACMIFKELQPVTVDDVKEWFTTNGIYESEQRRLQLAEALFREQHHRRMADVEVALEEIHRAFLSEQHLEYGSVG